MKTTVRYVNGVRQIRSGSTWKDAPESAEELRQQRADFEAMLASRQPPALHGTDTQLFKGTNPFPHMPESLRQHYLKQAKSQGIDVSGKVYMTGLVRPEFKGRFDPEALISPSKANVKKILEDRGWSTDENADCMVTVKAPEIEQDVSFDYRVAEDLVEEHTLNAVAELGIDEMKVSEFKELKEKTRTRLEGAK